MSLNLRAWHNWSKAEFEKFYELLDNGKLVPSDFTKEDAKVVLDRNFNSFNMDLEYSWWFAPGSQISVVFKDAFLEQTTTLKPRYFDNVNHTFSSPQSNMLSVKVLYYIDYLTVKNKLGKSKV
jgi:hypothetical protein